MPRQKHPVNPWDRAGCRARGEGGDVFVPVRCLSVGRYPEQDVNRLPWKSVLQCPYGWNCWRPGCACVHDQARERHEHVRDLADFWTAALKNSVGESDIVMQVAEIRRDAAKAQGSTRH